MIPPFSLCTAPSPPPPLPRPYPLRLSSPVLESRDTMRAQLVEHNLHDPVVRAVLTRPLAKAAEHLCAFVDL